MSGGRDPNPELVWIRSGDFRLNYDGKMIVKAVVKDPRTNKWVARSANPSHADIAFGRR